MQSTVGGTGRTTVPPMIPDTFGNFFFATAGVSGALIGLLFVAISVAPQRTTPLAELQFDLRTAKAFALFSNALVISLFALIPTIDLGATAMIVGVVSLASCVAMVLVTLREGPSGSRSTELLRIVIQGAVFVYQIVIGAQVAGTKDDSSGVTTLAVLVVVMLLIGMARAWQLLGAREISLLHLLTGSRSPAVGDRGGATPHDDHLG